MNEAALAERYTAISLSLSLHLLVRFSYLSSPEKQWHHIIVDAACRVARPSHRLTANGAIGGVGRAATPKNTTHAWHLRTWVRWWIDAGTWDGHPSALHHSARWRPPSQKLDDSSSTFLKGCFSTFAFLSFWNWSHCSSYPVPLISFCTIEPYVQCASCDFLRILMGHQCYRRYSGMTNLFCHGLF